MDFLTFEALIPALTTLLVTRHCKDGRRLFAIAATGALAAGWVSYRWATASGSEDTGLALFFGYLAFAGPISGLLGAWLALGMAIAVSREKRSAAILGAVAGIATTPIALLAWSSVYFEPKIRPEILPWMIGGTVAFYAACGAILGGLLDRFTPPRVTRWSGFAALGMVLVLDGARSHDIRDHVTPVSVLVARRDIVALRTKAEDAVRNPNWGMVNRYNGAPSPITAYAAVDTIAALRHPAEEVRFEAARILSARNDRRAVPVLREMLDEPYIDPEAAETLGRWKDAGSIPALEKNKQTDALEAIGGKDAEAALIRISTCDDSWTRASAAKSLLRFHSPASKAAIRRWCNMQIRALHGTPSESTAQAARSLRDLRMPSCRCALREYHDRLLRDASRGNRTLWNRSAYVLEIENTPESRRLRHVIAHTYR